MRYNADSPVADNPYVRERPEGTVVDLGCGLSTRFDRLDNGRLRWFDLDVEDTMALRRKFFDDGDRYTMIAGSLFDTDWYPQIAAAFPASPFAFDTGGAIMMNNQDSNPVFKAVPARMKWICEDPATLAQYGLRCVSRAPSPVRNRRSPVPGRLDTASGSR